MPSLRSLGFLELRLSLRETILKILGIFGTPFEFDGADPCDPWNIFHFSAYAGECVCARLYGEVEKIPRKLRIPAEARRC